MTELEVFEFLFEIAKKSRDPEGVVAAVLIRDGKILVSSSSSDDSVFHAEFLVIKLAQDENIFITSDDQLFTTLEPCSDLPNINDGRDCVTCILDAGIKKVIYAARDPEYSTKAAERFAEAGVDYKQIDNLDIIKRAENMFNSTIVKNLSAMRLPRKEKIGNL